MCIQTTLDITSVMADITLERLLPRVGPKMHLQMILPFTSIGADVTFERLFPSVDPKMPFHFSWASKSLPTPFPRTNTGHLQKKKQRITKQKGWKVPQVLTILNI
jgi:hypothetical protein